jgi:hypothetical protein
MRFYLGVWNSSAPISDGEAAARYRVLSAEKSAEPKFDPHVYAFYCRLTSLYPELEMVPEDDLGSCPWACSLDVAGDHVIMAIQLEQSAELVPKVLTLAAQHELVCFDPQATKVHLPPHLGAQQVAKTGPACTSGSQTSAIQLNCEPETSGEESLQPNPSCGGLPEQ